MVFRALISVSICFASALQLAGATAQPDKINGLLNNSPFGQSRTGATAAGGTNDPLEFRAVLGEGGGLMFSLYDTAAHRSVWVQMKDSSNGFAVNEYDAAKESVTVDYHGRAMVLPIKRAPAVAVAQPPRPNMPVSTGVGPTPIQPGQPGQVGPSTIDQQRIQQIQEEIRRRRALREQPGGSTTSSGPQPTQTTTFSPSGGPQPLAMPSGSTGPQLQPAPANSSVPQPTPTRP